MAMVLSRVNASYNWILEKLRNKVSRKWILIGGGVLLLVIILIWAFANKKYYRYKVVDSQVLESGHHTYYDSFGNYILRFNQDGISLSDFKGVVSFNGTYEMNNPILKKSKSHFAVLDQEGTSVYIYKTDGEVGHFQTPLPIIKGEVSDNGIIALLLNGGSSTWIYYYDSKGELLAENKTTMEESGYPIDLAISDEGSLVGVSYVQVIDANLKSKIIFYNFGKGGQSQLNYVVREELYPDTLISDIEYLGRGRYVTFSDKGFVLFEGLERPKMIKTVEVKEEIKSIICEDGYIGMIVFDLEKNEPMIKLFNSNGKETGYKPLDRDYIHIRHNNSGFVTFGNQQLSVYRNNGRLAYGGEYRFPIKQIIQGKSIGDLLIIGENYVERVKLQ